MPLNTDAPRRPAVNSLSGQIDTEYPFYIFDDVSGIFWPDEYASNHTAQDHIIAFAEEMGVLTSALLRRATSESQETAIIFQGQKPIFFDSESGGFNAFCEEEAPLIMLIDLIIMPLAERKRQARIEASP